MKQRIITGIILVLLLAIILFIVPKLFIPAVIIIFAVSLWEWVRISKLSSKQAIICVSSSVILLLLSIYSEIFYYLLLTITCIHYIYAARLVTHYEKIQNFRISSEFLTFSGPIVLSTLSATLIDLYSSFSGVESVNFAMPIAFIVLTIATADSGAYFIGKTFGKTKLSPKVSPNKTIEGLIGGLVCVVIFSLLFSSFITGVWNISMWEVVLFALTSSLVSIVGDLFISIIKRQNNIKDSSNILPGHGGVLDRIDALLAGIPFFYLVILLFS